MVEVPICSKCMNVTSITAAASKPVTTSTRQRATQNFSVIWLDASINESDDCSNHLITQLRRFVSTINTFIDADQCIDFLTEIKEKRVLMIISCNLGQCLIDLIHDVPQLNSIYIFYNKKSICEPWTNTWSKVRGVFTQINHLIESVERATRQCDQDAASVSFFSDSDINSKNLNQLNQSFMYTQILKEILFEIDYNEQSIRDLIVYCRDHYVDNNHDLTTIDQFERNYHLHSPIWWYTGPFFIYSMLNCALRTLQVDTIIKMGFFIHDLHRNIQKLHSKKVDDCREPLFLVYRGQGLSEADFHEIRKRKGGLMSFNNFLSTSKERDISYVYALSSLDNFELIGIIFEITINTSISSVRFADINNVSYFPSENEILFSMHTVFRIGEMKQIDDHHRLWEVKLTLTSDNDSQLNALTERMRRETKGVGGWDRLGKLLVKLGEFHKAEHVYQTLLNQTTNDSMKSYLYHMLGSVKDDLGDYVQALSFYKRSIEIYQKTLPSNHPDFISAYNNIAATCVNMGDYSQAFSYYERVVEVRQRMLPPNHPDLATSLNNIGFVFFKKNQYLKALSYYERALTIYQRGLPSNHPSLSSSYNNIAGVYQSISKYTEALSYLEKALEIDQRSLPPNHPDLASDYNNIGWVYENMYDYSKAIPFYERAIAIGQRSLPLNHPTLRTYKRNVERTRKKL